MNTFIGYYQFYVFVIYLGISLGSRIISIYNSLPEHLSGQVIILRIFAKMLFLLSLQLIFVMEECSVMKRISD